LRFLAETVIIALGLRADRSLADALENQGGLEVRVIGDCVEPREALEAVWEGFEVGRALVTERLDKLTSG
jgi:2-enoate reductase